MIMKKKKYHAMVRSKILDMLKESNRRKITMRAVTIARIEKNVQEKIRF